MTLAMVWTEKRGDCEILSVAADSLLTSMAGGRIVGSWPFATKIFQLHPSSHFVAYCGDSLGALHAILQGVSLLNSSTVLGMTSGPNCPQVAARAMAIRNHLDPIMRAFPATWSPPDATLIVCGWDFRKRAFDASELAISRAGATVKNDISLATPLLYGSGKAFARKWLGLDDGGAVTRERMLGVLQKAILAKSEPRVGGVPQMALMFQGCESQPVSFLQNVGGKDEKCLYGVPLQFKSDLSRVLKLDKKFKEIRPRKRK